MQAANQPTSEERATGRAAAVHGKVRNRLRGVLVGLAARLVGGAREPDVNVRRVTFLIADDPVLVPAGLRVLQDSLDHVLARAAPFGGLEQVLLPIGGQEDVLDLAGGDERGNQAPGGVPVNVVDIVRGAVGALEREPNVDVAAALMGGVRAQSAAAFFAQ